MCKFMLVMMIEFCFCRRKVLVTHENSNIEITGQILQCLRPGAWLNDEVKQDLLLFCGNYKYLALAIGQDAY